MNKVPVSVMGVVDYRVKVRVKSDGIGVGVVEVKMSLHPFDETVVEESVRSEQESIDDDGKQTGQMFVAPACLFVAAPEFMKTL